MPYGATKENKIEIFEFVTTFRAGKTWIIAGLVQARESVFNIRINQKTLASFHLISLLMRQQFNSVRLDLKTASNCGNWLDYSN